MGFKIEWAKNNTNRLSQGPTLGCKKKAHSFKWALLALPIDLLGQACPFCYIQKGIYLSSIGSERENIWKNVFPFHSLH